uniref:Uncharacterized protein n=1 Tax=Klebsiella pneumoniae TaxID=573 RepID=A0A6M3HIH9_KLEPN|nr:hypothetical protein [Escherichia coli]QIS32268.1 hypothetical protein [Klebsiella pneumoniae]UWM20622.1 hypothetical protein EDKNGFFE_00335 [Escherichia coli]
MTGQLRYRRTWLALTPAAKRQRGGQSPEAKRSAEAAGRRR